MKKLIFTILVIMCSGSNLIRSQEPPAATIQLLTVGPGTATYSIYGHSALRIIIPEKGTDLVYNWGVFDFNTKHFAWKFAKGRLEYNLGVVPYDRFLQEYLFEKRWVQAQTINLEPSEIEILFDLIAVNLKPENISYRYDFFYDDCSTRIRDLLEKAIGPNMMYPPDDVRNKMTFRARVGQYQAPYPWLDMGIDLIMGTPGDKKASIRDKMFLPIDLQEGLSEVVIRRGGRMVPLLQNPVTELEFDNPQSSGSFLTGPVFVFSLILILAIFFSALVKEKKFNRIFDLVFFSFFSVLALMMLFFGFFSDHAQMKMNLNIIWLNPFIVMCLITLIMKKDWVAWFRLVFFLATIAFVIILLFQGGFNNAFIPIILLLMLRSSVRADFSWNPLSAA